jgi:hypothetical protein
LFSGADDHRRLSAASAREPQIQTQLIILQTVELSDGFFSRDDARDFGFVNRQGVVSAGF